MSRQKVNYNELDLEHLDAEDLINIEIKAKALSLDECFDFLCIDKNELPESDLKWATLAHKRGRVIGVATACDNLFAAMKVRGGVDAAILYLKQTAGEFKIDATGAPGSQSGFSFTVNMPKDD